MQIPMIKFSGDLFVTAGSWAEADASDPAAVVLVYGSGKTRTLDAEQSQTFLETAAALPLIALPGGLYITAGTWAEIEAGNRAAVVITYGSGQARTLNETQSAEFLKATGIERPLIERVPILSRLPESLKKLGGR